MSSATAPRKRRLKPFWSKLFKSLLVMGLLLAATGVGAAYAIVSRLSQGLPSVDGLASYEAPQTTRIYSRDGQVIATLFVENRTALPLDRMSPFLVKALLAVEDSRFYQHHGVDWVGVARAAVANLLFRGIDQGASTLTMQLARNRFLSLDQTMARKIREIVLALRIEKKYSKEKILEYYLNNVYFGSGAYGVAAASSLYFGRSAEKLSIAQSALIAGLVQAPSSLSPLVDAEAAIARMKIVLGRMKQTGVLSPAQYDQALKEGEGFRFQHGSSGGGSGSDQLLKYPYFSTYVIAQLAQRYPEDMLYRAGLQVHTTLDIELQKLAEEELALSMEALGPDLNAHNAALVLIENSTGQIRAMVGGVRWTQNNQFNRAWQALRQPGSSFKAFVYAAALLKGMTPESSVEDSPTTFGDWTPKNSDGKFRGKMTMGLALQESRNVVAARLCQEVGSDRVVEVARAMGIREPLKSHLALALGACEVSPLSMASAYSTIASGGIFREPLAVLQVLDNDGQVLTDNRGLEGKRILPKDIACQLIEMLMRVVDYGTGTAARLDGVDAAGKTGTTDDSRDAWFVGFTPEYTLACWVGNDDHSAMWGVYGGGLPAQIWQKVMSRVVARGYQQARFHLEEGGTAIKICSESGLLAGEYCPETREKRQLPGARKPESCSLHMATPSPTPETSPTPEESLEPEATMTPEIAPTPEATPQSEEGLPTPLPPEPEPEALLTPAL